MFTWQHEFYTCKIGTADYSPPYQLTPGFFIPGLFASRFFTLGFFTPKIIHPQIFHPHIINTRKIKKKYLRKNSIWAGEFCETYMKTLTSNTREPADLSLNPEASEAVGSAVQRGLKN